MAHVIDRDDPDYVIAMFHRNRHIRIFAVVAGLVLALGILFAASAAMYSADPAARALGTEAN